MTTASEILARTATPETEPHIVINKDRTVTVPPELQVIAVQFDHNIETVTFDCPRYWDEHDLSELRIFINYMRADKKVGQFYCTNVSIDETDDTVIHFTWTIGGHLTEVAGGVSFLVCAKASNEAGELLNRWSSFLNQEMSIAQGLLGDGAIEKLYPDGIMEILMRLDSLVHASSGNGPPTDDTVGSVGLLYMDLDTKLMYKCVDVSDGVYTWGLVDGEDGEDGVGIVSITIEGVTDKTYKLKILLSNDTEQEVEFTVPQGPQGIQGEKGEKGETGETGTFDDTTGVVPVEHGGTGVESLEELATELGPILGAAKIQTGSYVGTGTCGSANPNELTFDFEPKIVMLLAYEGIPSDYADGAFSEMRYSIVPNPTIYCPWLSTEYEEYKGFAYKTSSGSTDYYAYAKKSPDGKTISWYTTPDSANAQYNLNVYEYHWLAIG